MSAESNLSAIDLKDNDKVNVIVSLHGHFRNHIQFWHDQVYKAATWSILMAYALVGYRLDDSLDRGTLSIILTLIVLVGTLSGFYLKFCNRAYHGNWEQIINCQQALRLHEPGVYFPKRSFYGGKAAQGQLDAKLEGIHAKDFLGLRIAHSLAIAAAVGIMIFRLANV